MKEREKETERERELGAEGGRVWKEKSVNKVFISIIYYVLATKLEVFSLLILHLHHCDHHHHHNIFINLA